MIKLRNMLIATIAIVSFSTTSFAGAGFGVTGSLLKVNAEGTEKDTDGTADTSTRKGDANANALVGSLFAEYTIDQAFGITLGVDLVPGKAEVNDENLSRTDNAFLDAEDGTRTANAEISNHYTVYAEVPMGSSGYYAKAGWVSIDVETTETNTQTDTQTGYGNDQVDGYQLGIGYKSGFGDSMYYKIEGSYTDFEDITVVSKDTDKGNTINADLDVTRLTFALGYAF